MDSRLLSTLIEVNGMTQSDLARAAGVTRQAVSVWFRAKAARSTVCAVDPKLSVVARIGAALGIDLNVLAAPFPLSADEQAELGAALLWDGLYPSLTLFCAALLKGDSRAAARLVEVFGFFEAEKIIGRRVWREFPRFRRYIIPARAKQCEQLWKMRQDRTLR